MGLNSAKPQVLACFSLACLFSSIWMTDRLSELILTLPDLVLAMRVFSLVWYALVFAAIVVFQKRAAADRGQDAGARAAGRTGSLHADPAMAGNGGLSNRQNLAARDRTFLWVASIAGFACFLLGVGVIGYASIANPTLFQSQPLVALTTLFLLKAVGAPVSILLVCAFARLRQNQAVSSTIIGYALAFTLYALLSFLQVSDLFSELGLALLACVMMGGALLFGIRGLHAPEQNVIARPYRQIVTANFVVGVMIASIMLGYLRSTTLQNDPNSMPGVIVALVVVAIIAMVRRGMREDILFKLALGSTAAGILLAPLLGGLPAVEASLMGFGSDLFEIVVWVLAVWAARNCQAQLLAAGAARLAIVAGHLLGTLIAVVALTVIRSDPEALHASSLFVVFVFVILLLFFSQNPRVELPIFAPHYPVERATRRTSDRGDQTSGVQAPASSSAAESNAVEGDAAVTRSATNRKPAKSRMPTEAEISKLSSPSKPTPQATAPKSPADSSWQADTISLSTSVSPPSKTDSEEDPYWQAPCTYIAQKYDLTPRETNILEQLARGRDLNSMAEKFVLSPNTVKMHIRNIYQKLDIHSKQDVINMAEEARHALSDS